MSDPRITDAAAEAALDVVMDDGHNGLDCRPGRNLGLTVIAALEAAAKVEPQPAVDPQALDALLRRHQVGAFAGEDTACYCDRKWRKNAAYREHLRDAVMALLNGSAS